MTTIRSVSAGIPTSSLPAVPNASAAGMTISACPPDPHPLDPGDQPRDRPAVDQLELERAAVAEARVELARIVTAIGGEVDVHVAAGFGDRAGADLEIGRGHLRRSCRRFDRDRRLVLGGARRDHLEHVDDEAQRIAGLDHLALVGVAVGEVGGDVELVAATGLRTDQTLVPTGDHAADAELELERHRPVPAVVELFAVRAAHPDVLDDHQIIGCGRLALAGRRAAR